MCVFCQIVRKEIPAEVIFENEEMIAFKDIKPSAPIHILVIPKKHIKSLAELSEEDQDLLGRMLYQLKEIAKKFEISERGYKTVINTGKEGGQIVEHLHIHLLGGGELKHLV